MTFKPDDRVIFAKSDRSNLPRITGVVKSVNHSRAYPYEVLFEGQLKPNYLSREELALAEPVGATPLNPAHYRWLPNGLEVIDLAEHLTFCLGNAVKYLCRAGRKEGAPEIQDLQKAIWYINREITRIKKENKSV